MAQNTQSATASRSTVPGTATEQPIGPVLFTAPSKREYIPDNKRIPKVLETPELARARALFVDDDFRGARAEARKALRRKDLPELARMEALDLLDKTDIDHGPLAAAVAFLILFGLMLMYFATSGK